MEGPQAFRHVVREVPKVRCARCGQEKPAWSFEGSGYTPLCKECRAADAAEVRRVLIRRLLVFAVGAVAVAVVLLGFVGPRIAARDAYEHGPVYSMRQLGRGVTLANLLIVKRYYDETAVRNDLQKAFDAFQPASEAESVKLSDWYSRSFVAALKEASATVVSECATSAVISYRVVSAEDSSACVVLARFTKGKDAVGVYWKLDAIANGTEVVQSVIGRPPGERRPAQQK